MATSPKKSEPIVFEPMVIKARPEVVKAAEKLALMTQEEKTFAAPAVNLTEEEKRQLLSRVAQFESEKIKKDLDSKLYSGVKKAASAAGPGELLSRAIGGAFSGLTETVADYASMLDPSMYVRSAANPYSSEAKFLADRKIKTAGDEFREDIVEPRLKQTGAERVIAPVTDIIVSVPAFYHVFTKGTEEQKAQLAEQVGRALTRGTIGNVEQFIKDPAATTAAMPSETLLALFPVLRGFGALFKTAPGAGKVAKAARAVGEVMSPTPRQKVLAAVRDESLDAKISSLTPNQLFEYNELKKIDPVAANHFVDSANPVPKKVTKVGPEPGVATRTGKALYRAIPGGALGAAITGDPLVAMFSAAGVALTPEIASGLMAVASQYNLNVVNVAKKYINKYGKDLSRTFDDPANVGSAAEAHSVRSLMESGAQAESIAAKGKAASYAAESAGPQAVSRVYGVTPLQASRQSLVASDVGFTEPLNTVAPRQAALASEQAAKAGAPAAKIKAQVFRSQAQQLAEDASGGDPSVKRALLRSAKTHDRIVEALPLLGEKGKQYARDIKKFETSRPDVAQAYYVAKLRDEAVNVHIQSRWVAGMTKKLEEKLSKASPAVQMAFFARERAKPFGATIYKRKDKPFEKFFRLSEGYANHTYESIKAKLNKADLERLERLERYRARVDSKVAKVKGSKAGLDIQEAIGDSVELNNLKTALKKEAAALRKDGGENAFRRLQSVYNRLKETIEAENQLKLRLSKYKISLDKEAPGLIDTVANMRGSSRAARRLKESVNKAPKTEKQLRRKAGQDVPETFADKIPGQGGTFDIIARTSKDPVVRAFHQSIADIYKRINPTHRLADPEYLNQIVANAWSKNALVGAFSARVRGAFSKQLFKDLSNTNPAGLKAYIDQAIEKSSKPIREFKAGLEDVPFVGKAVSEKARERFFREAIEKEIVDRMSKPIAAGEPVNLKFVLPTGPDTPPLVISPGTVAAELIEAGAKNKEYKGILREAIDGLHSTLAKNLQTDIIHGELGAEALRGANPVATAGQELNAFATVRRMKAGEDKPSIILFDPQAVLEQLPAPGESIPVELEKTLRSMGLTVEDVRSTLQTFAKNTEEASNVVAQGVRSGLKNRGKSDFGSHPIYVTKGYNDSVGTHIGTINNAHEATTILGMIGEEIGQGTSRLLIGSTATKVSNALSNVTAIATAMGASPTMIFGGSAKQYLRLMAAQRGGQLKMPGLPEIKLTPYQMQKVEAMQNARVINSAMFGPEIERMFKSSDTSQGFFKSKWRAYWNLRKEAYKAVDAAPKMFLTDKSFDTLHAGIKKLEPGRSFSMPLGRGTYMRVTKTADGHLLWGSNKKRVALNSQEAANLIADSAKQFANNILFDMNDMPNFAKKLMSSRLGLTASVFNRYLSWQIKAMELPGKKGLFSHVLDYDPTNHIITDSPALNREKFKKSIALLAKRQGRLAAARALAEPYNNPGLSQDTGWSASTDIAAWNPAGDVDENSGGKMTMTQSSAAIVADQAVRLLEVAGAKAMEMFGYSTETAEKDALSKDPLDQVRARLYRNLKAGEIATPATVADYFALTGGMFKRTFDYLERGDARSMANAMAFANRLMLGGDISTAIDAAAGLYSPSLSTRRMVGPAGDKRPEDALQWIVAKMLRFGFREEDLSSSSWVKRRKARVKKSLSDGIKTDIAFYEDKIDTLARQKKTPERDAAIREWAEKNQRAQIRLKKAEDIVDFVSESFEKDFLEARARYGRMKRRYRKIK